ncbi:dihydrofolate reductase family protein [Metabacillus iocasae]|uniref:Dihydrofolate reductase n=1 Tax=Priestia iocasae TaxID=2291674 RepID=A0ABS2QXC9_9BACI|nr:dihydrofolate reductase family protein [Metabacillus iocasae]MBM7703657.1 dihydrofolate reductase [Metabacillus iocasae]
MRNVVLYIAATIDGYIAKENGDVAWLHEAGGNESYGYEEFYETVDTIFMGRKTYEQVLTFGEFPYKGKKCFVVTSSPRTDTLNEDIAFISPQEVSPTIKKLKEADGNKIWLIGGGALIQLFQQEHLIDEYMLFIVPLILGNGIPLFKNVNDQSVLVLTHQKSYESGFIELHYKPKG